MKDLNQLVTIALRTTKSNAPIILTSAAGVGVITTAYLTGTASYKAAHKIREDTENWKLTHPVQRYSRTYRENIKLVWMLYIPAGISAASTIVCIIGANRTGLKKTIAATTALGFTERAYSEYRDKVIEEFGAHKDQTIRDKVVASDLRENPPPPQDILVTGPGNVLCCELFTGRYFSSDMEKLRKAQNDINAKVLAHDMATLNDLYELIGLGDTTYGNDIGWVSSKLMELKFSTHLTDDGRPCVAFDYNYTSGV